MDYKPTYFTVIPSSVRYDFRLSYFEIVFFGEIVALSNTMGYCYASNLYFQKLFSLSESTIKRSLKNLFKYGHIFIVYNLKKTSERKIFITPPPGFKIDTSPGFKIDPLKDSTKSNNMNLNKSSIKRSFNSQIKREKPDISIPWLEQYLAELK